jgi:hypothetical protein
MNMRIILLAGGLFLCAQAALAEQTCVFSQGKNLEMFEVIKTAVVKLQYSPRTRELTSGDGVVYFPTSERTADGVLFINKSKPNDPDDRFYALIRGGRVLQFAIRHWIIQATFVCR